MGKATPRPLTSFCILTASKLLGFLENQSPSLALPLSLQARDWHLSKRTHPSPRLLLPEWPSFHGTPVSLPSHSPPQLRTTPLQPARWPPPPRPDQAS